MTSGAAYSPASIKRLNAAFRALPRNLQRGAILAIKKCTVRIHADAVTSMRAPGKGIVYGRRRHQASAPGDPPASDSGDLIKLTEFEFRDGGLKGVVGTNLDYGEHLEFGTSKMEARPWLRPAWLRQKQRCITEIGSAMKTGLRKGGRL